MALHYTDYNYGHPWYFVLGGAVWPPKQILETVKSSGYRGYMADDIQKIDRMAEPKRSEKLRKLQTKFTEDFWRDLLRYRELACALREYRKEDQPATCNDVHVNLGLKCSHLYNDLAHLCYLDGLLSKQPDLFDF